MSNEVNVPTDFTLEVNKVKSLKGRITKSGNIQISIFKKFEAPLSTPTTEGQPQPVDQSNLIGNQSTLRYKKIEDVILDKAKAKELLDYITIFLA